MPDAGRVMGVRHNGRVVVVVGQVARVFCRAIHHDVRAERDAFEFGRNVKTGNPFEPKAMTTSRNRILEPLSPRGWPRR